MNSKTWTRITLVLFAALALPLQLAAQDNAKPHHHHKYHHYQLIDVGTFGGPNSTYLQGIPVGRLLNKSGAAVGAADTPTPDPSCIGFDFDCYLAHGFKWQDGVASELGALPGFGSLNSSTGLWVSDNGLTAGISENGIDPLTGNPAVEAILWGKDGSLTDLGTLGGNASSANAVNNRGQVAGEALNPIPDPYTSNFYNFLFTGATQVHAFRWTKSRGMQDLGTLGGTDSAAFSMNQRGQIAGWSFTNTTVNPSTGVPTLDPFLWENGKLLDLGTLGGTYGNANALNSQGHVTGTSNLAGDANWDAFLWRNQSEGMIDLGTLGGSFGNAASINDSDEVVGADATADGLGRAFLWRHGVMTDLGTIGTDPASQAFSINSQGQVVGNTWDPNADADLRGFLWEHGGPMVDLNTLVAPNPDLQLTLAIYVNDRGEIAASGKFSNGDIHSFILIPCDENHSGVEGCDYSMVEAASAQQNSTPRFAPSGTLRPPQSRWSNRYRIPALRIVGQIGSGTVKRNKD
jgi:probable HAF family extracellular repeat protein